MVRKWRETSDSWRLERGWNQETCQEAAVGNDPESRGLGRAALDGGLDRTLIWREMGESGSRFL